MSKAELEVIFLSLESGSKNFVYRILAGDARTWMLGVVQVLLHFLPHKLCVKPQWIRHDFKTPTF